MPPLFFAGAMPRRFCAEAALPHESGGMAAAVKKREMSVPPYSPRLRRTAASTFVSRSMSRSPAWVRLTR